MNIERLGAFADDAECPCGSGLLVSMCVCKDRRFVPRSVLTAPKGPRTGVRVNGCYARESGNCEGPLTAEHAISRTVLEFVSHGKRTIDITNHRWQQNKSEVRRIGISRLTAKVLCARHNSSLANLDAFARGFIEACNACQLYSTVAGPPEDIHRLFNGLDIERWMLKVLCGLCAEQPIIGEELLGRWTPPKEWLSILFGTARFPHGCGLYMPAIPTERANAKNSIHTKPLYGQLYPLDANLLPIISSGQPKMPIGLDLSVFDLHFRLFMYPPPTENLFYRPRLHKFGASENPDRIAFLHLGWDERPTIVEGSQVHKRVGLLTETEARGLAWREHYAGKQKQKR
jgi:hypothetical protein